MDILENLVSSVSVTSENRTTLLVSSSFTRNVVESTVVGISDKIFAMVVSDCDQQNAWC